MGFRCRCFGDHDEVADSHCIGPDGKPAFNSTCDAVGKCYLKVTALSKTEHELRMGCLPPHQEGDLIDQCHLHLNFTENLESYYVCCDPTVEGNMCNDKLEQIVPEYNPGNPHEQQLGKLQKVTKVEMKRFTERPFKGTILHILNQGLWFLDHIPTWMVALNLALTFCNIKKLISLDFLFL